MSEETNKLWFNNQIGYDIWNKKYRHNNESLNKWFDRVSNNNEELKQRIKDKKFLFGGRTLSNRGTNKGSYSNCYSHGFVEDSVVDIMNTTTNLALTYKAQGGQGVSLTKIRPKGELIKGIYSSDGIIPWMEIFNMVTKSISQSGARKGALMMSIDIEHKDSKTFMTIKNDPNKINNANLSLEISDKFMNWVIDGSVQEFISREYDSGKIEYVIDPTELYNIMIKQAWKNAEPGVFFTNRFKNYNIMQFVDEYVIETSNPCGEQPLPKHSNCNLASINLSEYVKNPFTKNSIFDNESFKKDVRLYIQEMDKTIDENINNHALQEQKDAVKKWRNLGLGVMGYADMLIKLGLTYGSIKALEFTVSLYRDMFREAVLASIDLAQQFGTFPGYKEAVFDSTIMLNHFHQDELNKFKKIGLRNASLLSIAPTGSISTMFNISGGIEPIFAFSHKRRTESLNDNKKKEYEIFVKIVNDYLKVNNEIISKLPNYFVTAHDIKWQDKIQLIGNIQDSIDTAISSTTNLKKDVSLEEVHDLYIEAWKQGLKGITIYRDGSRDGILTTNSNSKLKRPESIPCDIHNVKIEGKQWTIIIGLLNNDPYEVFAFKNKNIHLNNVTNAFLVKRTIHGKNHYHITSDNVNITNLPQLYETGEEEFITRLISRLIRLGEIDTIIKDAEKTYKNIGTFVNVINRILSKYTNDIKVLDICPNCGKQLVMQEGCKSCSCGYSKC